MSPTLILFCLFWCVFIEMLQWWKMTYIRNRRHEDKKLLEHHFVFINHFPSNRIFSRWSITCVLSLVCESAIFKPQNKWLNFEPQLSWFCSLGETTLKSETWLDLCVWQVTQQPLHSAVMSKTVQHKELHNNTDIFYGYPSHCSSSYYG